jgi:hypothetical protein
MVNSFGIEFVRIALAPLGIPKLVFIVRTRPLPPSLDKPARAGQATACAQNTKPKRRLVSLDQLKSLSFQPLQPFRRDSIVVGRH